MSAATNVRPPLSQDTPHTAHMLTDADEALTGQQLVSAAEALPAYFNLVQERDADLGLEAILARCARATHLAVFHSEDGEAQRECLVAVANEVELALARHRGAISPPLPSEEAQGFVELFGAAKAVAGVAADAIREAPSSPEVAAFVARLVHLVALGSYLETRHDECYSLAMSLTGASMGLCEGLLLAMSSCTAPGDLPGADLVYDLCLALAEQCSKDSVRLSALQLTRYVALLACQESSSDGWTGSPSHAKQQETERTQRGRGSSLRWCARGAPARSCGSWPWRT